MPFDRRSVGKRFPWGFSRFRRERVAQLVEMKLLRRCAKKVSKRRHYFVLKSEIEALRPSLHDGIDFAEAALITGMQAPLFKRLARSSLYKVRYVAASGGPLAREDVHEFSALLEKFADVRLSPKSALTLRRVLQIKGSHQLNYSAVINRALKALADSR